MRMAFMGRYERIGAARAHELGMISEIVDPPDALRARAQELVAEGVTIFLTSHYLEEADVLADRVAVLVRGRLIAEGTPDELKRLIPGGFVRLELADSERLGSAATAFPDGTRDEDALTLQKRLGAEALDGADAPVRPADGERGVDRRHQRRRSRVLVNICFAVCIAVTLAA